MKTLQQMSSARAMRVTGRAWVFGAALLIGGVAHAAPVQVEVWHTLTNANQAELDKLVKQYNKEQGDVEVKLRGFATSQALKQEASAAVKAKRQPNLIQLDDDRSPEAVAEFKAIKPLYELLAKYPIKDLAWFLPATTSFTRDAKGRLLAFPLMAEVPVMFYNIAAYKKAGLDPNAPARTWAELQDQLLKLRDKADMDCPYATSDQVAVHLESLAPVNGQLYASNNNGLEVTKSKVAPQLQFDILYMRHISLMASWKRSLLFTNHSEDDQADQLFAKGTCGVLTSGSGAIGNFSATKGLTFGVAPLPYYPQATPTAGRPFVTGGALWAMEGHPAASDKATAAFLAWLSKPVVAAEWHQATGYLPLTEAAFRASDVSYYSKIPGAQQFVTAMRTQPAPTGRGFRMNNYSRIEPVLSRELDDAIDGKTPPMSALNKAAAQAKVIAEQK
ncbi:extracellular solute-binding protein [Bordetella sp. N]|uniref:extracellular solute-binding protein n=1 Tax=Bordetella sp. N TaxID=1746199 RepID=UPI00070E9E65|nr:extracellular solute-binding protein [Bordetella sp. N]ALM83758.1 glycerol-3-phosphate ABC transporter substrate-binding protein [Bordetella sp. N]